MNTVDEVVRERILVYPALFSNRTEVLHTILCVAGSGYSWDENGCPSRTFEDSRDTQEWSRENYLGKLNAEYENFDSFVLDLLMESAKERADKYAAIVAEVDTRMHLRVTANDDSKDSALNFYPQFDYALLMNVPQNVTADWAEACEEIRAEAVSAGWVF